MKRKRLKKRYQNILKGSIILSTLWTVLSIVCIDLVNNIVSLIIMLSVWSVGMLSLYTLVKYGTEEDY